MIGELPGLYIADAVFHDGLVDEGLRQPLMPPGDLHDGTLGTVFEMHRPGQGSARALRRQRLRIDRRHCAQVDDASGGGRGGQDVRRHRQAVQQRPHRQFAVTTSM